METFLEFVAAKYNGWDQETGRTDHNSTMNYVKTLNQEQLLYVRNDAQEALDANPDNPKAGYYQDLMHYCNMRLNGKL